MLLRVTEFDTNLDFELMNGGGPAAIITLRQHERNWYYTGVTRKKFIEQLLHL